MIATSRLLRDTTHLHLPLYLQLLAQALPGLPFPASMMTSMQQPQSQYLTDFGPDAGLVGSGFGIDPASELIGGQDMASDHNGKRRRAPERRSGARSTSKYRGVTHHCRTGRRVLLLALAMLLTDAPCLGAAGKPTSGAYLDECFAQTVELWLTHERTHAGKMRGRSTWAASMLRSRPRWRTTSRRLNAVVRPSLWILAVAHRFLDSLRTCYHFASCRKRSADQLQDSEL